VYDQCQAVLHEVARLSELASADRAPSGPLRLGLTQGIADIVLRDAGRGPAPQLSRTSRRACHRLGQRSSSSA
jgi:hypothetical protein